MSQQYTPITLITQNNTLTNARYYQTKPSKQGVILVGGIGGNFDTPAKNLYPTLATALQNQNITTLRVEFRYPTLLEESVQDVLTGAKFLQTEGITAIGLVGHSFGGAVVIQAGAQLEKVKTVVTLSTQSYGADKITDLTAHASILLIHGSIDEILLVRNSQLVFERAGGRKRLEVLEGNRHGLEESAGEVFCMVHDWLVAELKR